jgi:Uma2 family endonuclease
MSTIQPTESSSRAKSEPVTTLAEKPIHYPDSDGEPVANNTKHYEIIATTKSGLELLFRDRDDVFVAADLFWYPVQGKPNIVVAPDIMVAFGRPPGPRRSYKQWEEANTPFHVVFEFLSESNTASEMSKKALFFDHYGVEEYYLYDMDNGTLEGFVRYGGTLELIETEMNGWVSPRLGIRFEVEWSGSKHGLGEPDFALYYPDGTRFLSYLELTAELERAESERQRAESERDSVLAELQAERERARAMAAKLKELGIQL